MVVTMNGCQELGSLDLVVVALNAQIPGGLGIVLPRLVPFGPELMNLGVGVSSIGDRRTNGAHRVRHIRTRWTHGTRGA